MGDNPDDFGSRGSAAASDVPSFCLLALVGLGGLVGCARQQPAPVLEAPKHSFLLTYSRAPVYPVLLLGPLPHFVVLSVVRL